MKLSDMIDGKGEIGRRTFIALLAGTLGYGARELQAGSSGENNRTPNPTPVPTTTPTPAVGYPREVKGSSEMLREYHRRMEEFADKKEADIETPIGVGENHFYNGDTMPTIRRFLEQEEPSALGLEMVPAGDTKASEFNEGEITPSEMASYFNSKLGSLLKKDDEQLKEVFSAAREHGTEVRGLEPSEIESGFSSVREFEERSEALIDNAEKITNEKNGDAVFYNGYLHVDSRISIMNGLRKGAQPELATSLDPEDIVEHPRIWLEYEDELREPHQNIEVNSFSDTRALTFFPETYTLSGRIDSLTPVLATQPYEQRKQLEGLVSVLEDEDLYSEEGGYPIIQEPVSKLQQTVQEIDDMTEDGHYFAQAESGYWVSMEPDYSLWESQETGSS